MENKNKKIKTISIIGGTGKMGQMFADAFSSAGLEVIVAGRKTAITMEEAASKGDVVIVCVPIRNFEETVKRISAHLRKDALLSDFTSVKVNPCNVMMKSFAGEVIGGHPVFGPNNGMNGRPFVLCPARKGKKYEEFKEIIGKLGVRVEEMTASEHDKTMAVVQCLNHFANIAFANALKNMKFDIAESDKLASPNYLLRIYAMGRFLADDGAMYADIETENPYSKEFAQSFVESSKEILEKIENNDKEGFEDIFKTNSNYFGNELKEKSVKRTNEVLKNLSEMEKNEK